MLNINSMRHMKCEYSVYASAANNYFHYKSAD